MFTRKLNTYEWCTWIIIFSVIFFFVGKAHAQSEHTTYSYGGVQISGNGVVLSPPHIGYWQPQPQYGTWVPPNMISILPEQPRIGIIQQRYGAWSPAQQPNWQPRQQSIWGDQNLQNNRGLDVQQVYIGEQRYDLRFSIGGIPISVSKDRYNGTRFCFGGSSWGCF
jgi:hypothetical protein